MCQIPYEKYAPLHAHSPYSKDGYGPWELMIKRAKELGIDTLAMTDHGTVSGFVHHWQLCNEHGIKPIFGVEAYLSPDPNAEKVITNHITILAQTEQGYKNLIGLNNAAHRNMIKKRSMKFPLTTFRHIRDYAEGLVILTGCPASMIHHEDFNVAYDYVSKLVQFVGEENVFAELMFTLDGQDFHSRPLAIASELGIRPVITNDTHFTYAEDAADHMMCTGIRSRAVTGTDYSYDNETLYLMSPEQLAERALENIDAYTVIDCFNNIGEIVDGIEAVDLANDVVVPYVSDEELVGFKKLVDDSLELYILDKPHSAEQARKAFYKEVEIIDKYDFWSYFFIVHDMVRWVREHGRFSTARGSAGGSFIIYLLDICTVDPLQYDLMFERFLSTARIELPDIDLDVDSTIRPELVEYCKKRWGLESVSTTITFGHRSLIRDIAAQFGITHDEMQHASNLEPGAEEFEAFRNGEDIEPQAYSTLKEEEVPESELKAYKQFVTRFTNRKAFAHTYDMMIDQPKTVGTHAAAMASVNNNLPIPIEAWGNTPGIAFSESGTLHHLSPIGGLKFDILGLTALASLHKMYELTGVLPPKDIDTEFPAEIFSTGRTLGIFQFDGSKGIQELCVEVSPQGLNELATVNSLYRPGALDAGTAAHYMEYKLNPRQFHPRIDPILASTYSVIVFQEQVMGIYAEVTGEGLEGADEARRILSPKSVKVLSDPKWQTAVKEVEANFFKKGNENGFGRQLLGQLWSELYTHSRYSFNKSHSIAYADLAARQAWYKVNYPNEFYLAILNTLQVEGRNNQMQDYIWAMFLEGTTIMPPSIIHSSTEFEMKDGKIYLPITVTKFVAPRTLEAISFLKAWVNKEEYNIEGRVNTPAYFDEVMQRFVDNDVTAITCESLALLSKAHTFSKRAKDNLYRVGAFDGVPGDINVLVDAEALSTVNMLANYIECMDVTVPVPFLRKFENGAKKRGLTFGIIVKKIEKVTRKGVPVVVYVLTDNRYVRINKSRQHMVEHLDLSVGMPVLAECDGYNYLRIKKGVPQIKCVTHNKGKK